MSLTKAGIGESCVTVGGEHPDYPIAGGRPVAPFAGTFKPEQAQVIFGGENPQGDWVLRVVDSVAADRGQGRSVELDS